jgi:osmoprotectant transport system permease protein
MRLFCLIGLWLAAAAVPADAAGAGDVPFRVGSKKFTENVILGELAAQLARSEGARVVHLRELGGTRILWNALLRGEIDAYPEYTGTLREEILASEEIESDAALDAALAARGLGRGRPLGFNNTYAMGMKEEVAARLDIRTISDLRRHPALKLGFGNEFMDREDGWPGLRRRYALPHRDVRGLDHDLAYRGLERGTLHVMDLYATDAEISYYRLRVLADDLGHFPAYHAVLLTRNDLSERLPAVAAALRLLEGKFSDDSMIAMNARAKLDKVPEARVAADFLSRVLGVESEIGEDGRTARFLRHTRDHLFLVAVSLGAAILISLPLGILAARLPRFGQAILGAVGIIQTVPSLALLVFMIPLLGIGAAPAIVALFLYSLLPIVRNTHAGLTNIPLPIRESAEALGLSSAARLRLVELPMASTAILAGIKTSAVINVGTATLGALIGAGGYGQPILTGIRLDDVGLILEGAVPAAALALLAQGLFEGAERFLVPRGLRLKGEA